MTAAFLIQTIVSALAVFALVGLAAWLGRPKAIAPLDEAAARRLFAEELPGADIDAVCIAPDGKSALARFGDAALIAYRAGDGFVVREAPLSVLSAAQLQDGRALLRLDDVAAPRAVFALPTGAPWPPRALVS
jgi:hypothetical protein